MTENNKLDPLAEMAFISEIVTQAKFADEAANRLAVASESTKVWGEIQSIIVAAANVSKILWPAKKYQARGKHLRNLLGIDQDNLLASRTFRNHFEHYDERIEEWFANNRSAVYMDLNISSLERTPWSLPQLFHRDYNSTSQTLKFRGESINLGAVINELELVRKKCQGFCIS